MKLRPSKNAFHAEAVAAVLRLSSFRYTFKTYTALVIKFFILLKNFGWRCQIRFLIRWNSSFLLSKLCFQAVHFEMVLFWQSTFLLGNRSSRCSRSALFNGAINRLFFLLWWLTWIWIFVFFLHLWFGFAMFLNFF